MAYNFKPQTPAPNRKGYQDPRRNYGWRNLTVMIPPEQQMHVADLRNMLDVGNDNEVIRIAIDVLHEHVSKLIQEDKANGRYASAKADPSQRAASVRKRYGSKVPDPQVQRQAGCIGGPPKTYSGASVRTTNPDVARSRDGKDRQSGTTDPLLREVF